MRVEAAVRLRRHRVDLALVGVQLVVEPAVVRAAPVPGRVQVLQAGLVEPGPVAVMRYSVPRPGRGRVGTPAIAGNTPGQKSPCGRWVRNELYRYQPPTWRYPVFQGGFKVSM